MKIVSVHAQGSKPLFQILPYITWLQTKLMNFSPIANKHKPMRIWSQIPKITHINVTFILQRLPEIPPQQWKRWTQVLWLTRNRKQYIHQRGIGSCLVPHHKLTCMKHAQKITLFPLSHTEIIVKLIVKAILAKLIILWSLLQLWMQQIISHRLLSLFKISLRSMMN